ncbi:unnamed protein product [Schistosoma rodhaini]|uniref:Uncharacterized protein n=1 Tax=Schistosoma rodhaini TaxID=6188 RepID=A0AA85ELW3_9TREM|nr:unnamed protein product [Schistosoma rodhaini]
MNKIEGWLESTNSFAGRGVAAFRLTLNCVDWLSVRGLLLSTFSTLSPYCIHSTQQFLGSNSSSRSQIRV